MIEFAILIVALVLSVFGFKKMKKIQTDKGTSKVLTLLASVSAAFIVFMVTMVIGFAAFVDTPKPVKKEVVQTPTKTVKAPIKEVQLIDVFDYLKDSPQYVFASFINAWASQDFEKMAKYTQLRWKSREKEPVKYLKNNYDFKHLKTAEITDVKQSGTAAYKITAHLTYTTPFNDKTDDVYITGMVIKENDTWGVNPISTLREE